MRRFSFRFLNSTGNYTKLILRVPCSPLGGLPAPRGGSRTDPLYWFTEFIWGTLISNIFSLQMCFWFQDEYFKWDPLYFTPRFCCWSPKFRVLDFNLMNLRNLFWVVISNFDFSELFPTKDMQTPPQFWSGYYGWCEVCWIEWKMKYIFFRFLFI